MEIHFDNPRHESIVNDFEVLRRRFGEDRAQEILGTIEVLRAADALFDVPRGYRPHPLKGVYKGCFAVNITNVERVIFRPMHQGDPNFRIDNPKSITVISIIEICKNYHGH